MPYTSWKSWATSEVLTSADMNAYVRDNGRWLSLRRFLGDHDVVTDYLQLSSASHGLLNTDRLGY